MSIDVSSMLIGLAHGKKSGKPPILAELTIIENGVYDQPMIGDGPDPIAWNGVIEGRHTVTQEDSDTIYVKISDTTPTMDDLAQCTYTMATGESVSLEGDISGFTEHAGVIMMSNGAMYVVSNPDTMSFLGTFETGTYVSYIPGTTNYIQLLTFANRQVADGWNKVVVSVPGDVVDVTEPPMESIDDTKIYRVTSGNVITYCIPNNATVQRLVDGTWVELI